MDTIEDKLSRLAQTKSDIRNALLKTGIAVPADAKFSDYITKILEAPCYKFPDLPGDVTRWSFKGLTNEQMSKNPRLEDADHKGRFLTFKNFAWGRMSGCGGYVGNYKDYTRWIKPVDRSDMTFTDHSFNVTSVKSDQPLCYYQSMGGDRPFLVSSSTVIIKGLTDGQTLVYSYVDIEGRRTFTIKNDGIYTLPGFEFIANGNYYGFRLTKIQKSCNITVEQLPFYPGFIIGDGVDDYAVTEKNLDFEDTYTVYTAFIPISKDTAGNAILCGSDPTKAFTMQYYSLNSIYFVAQLNNYLQANLSNGFNLFACKRNGNNIQIKNLLTNQVVSGTCDNWEEANSLYYLWRNANYASYAKAAIAGQVICNGHFTSDEEDTKVLNWYKKEYPWLFFDQAWTVTGKTNEDTDRATIANITGNGNNLVLSNFGFAGNSGYGEYACNWNNTSEWGAYSNNATFELTSSTIHITEAKSARPFLETRINIGGYNKTKIKVTGIKTGEILRFASDLEPNNAIIIKTDGNYSLPGSSVEYYGFRLSNSANTYPFNCDITIEQIPDHEGYLVTDGVDDNIVSSAFVLDKKFTVVGEWKFIVSESKRAGIVFPSKLYAYNEKENMQVYVNTPITGNTIRDIRCFKALTSEGKLYDNSWGKHILKAGDLGLIRNTIALGGFIQNNSFTQIAFKNLAIYPKALSKEDAIKAYIYLQTLKAK